MTVTGATTGGGGGAAAPLSEADVEVEGSAGFDAENGGGGGGGVELCSIRGRARGGVDADPGVATVSEPGSTAGVSGG